VSHCKHFVLQHGAFFNAEDKLMQLFPELEASHIDQDPEH
jgi:hypothetical protein